jgi:tetratricopeptide (TPR) repeat protein
MNLHKQYIVNCHSEGIRQQTETRNLLQSNGCCSLFRFTPFRMTVLSLLIFVSFGIFAQTASSPELLMQTANNAYNEGLYDSAINVYHQVEKDNIESAGLFYNLGNAYFKNGDIPSAILYYEKAKKLDPNNEDIQYNLSVANSMIVDKIEKVPELFFENWWNYFYNRFNADTWTLLSLASWFVLILLVGIFILTKKRGLRKLAFYLGLLFLFTSVATFGLASQKYYFGKEHKEAIIFTPTVTVKSSPTTNAVDLFVVHEGTKIEILDQVQDWTKIRIADGSVGWLPISTIREI